MCYCFLLITSDRQRPVDKKIKEKKNIYDHLNVWNQYFICLAKKLLL